MRADIDIRHDVEAELKWNPEIDSTDIAAKVTYGAVALYGLARNHHEKHQAELSVKRVAGVGAVVNDLAIRPTAADEVSDPQLAREALKALKHELPATWDKLRLMVRDGRVVIEGAGHPQFHPCSIRHTGWRHQGRHRGGIPPQRCRGLRSRPR
jgi:hypothetical protein